jgi:hypothetical protein
MSTFDDSSSDDENHGPRQDAAEHEERERLEARAARARHHHREDEGVNQQEQERVDERPEEAEGRPAVARFEFASHQTRDEGAVSKKLCKAREPSQESAIRYQESPDSRPSPDS